MGELRSLDPVVIPFYTNVLIVIIGIVVCLSSLKGFLPSEQDFTEHSKWLFCLLAFIC